MASGMPQGHACRLFYVAYATQPLTIPGHQAETHLHTVIGTPKVIVLLFAWPFEEPREEYDTHRSMIRFGGFRMLPALSVACVCVCVGREQHTQNYQIIGLGWLVQWLRSMGSA